MRASIKLTRAPTDADAVAPTPQMWNELVEAVERLGRLTAGAGLALSDGPGGLTISALRPDDGFWAWVTASTRDGDNWRWKYAWQQIYKSGAAYGQWSVLTGGLSGTSSSNTAYNAREDPNGTSGLFGNGVNSANLASTNLQIQPVPNQVPLWMRRLTTPDGTVEYWFEYENAIDGSC